MITEKVTDGFTRIFLGKARFGSTYQWLDFGGDPDQDKIAKFFLPFAR